VDIEVIQQNEENASGQDRGLAFNAGGELGGAWQQELG
jgi:hypothetical protein